MINLLVWIKNPLDVFAENCEGGVVVQGQKIIELVQMGQTPKATIDETYDASDKRLTAWIDQYSSSLLSDSNKSLS